MRCAEPTCQKLLPALYRPRERNFCNTKCSSKFHNRRAKRGAQIHDLLIEWLRDRPKITFVAQQVRKWRDEDARLARENVPTD